MAISPENTGPSQAEAPELQRTIDRLRSRPDKFVRVSRFIHRGESFPPTPADALQVRDDQLTRLKYHGLNIPHNETLGLVPGGGEIKGYEASDRVLGDLLSTALINKDPRLSSDMLNQHYTGQLNYLKEVHERGGFYMSDVTRNNDQSMLGHIATDLEDKLYVTDLEPILEEFRPGQADHDDNQWYYRGLSLLESSIQFAGMFGQDVEQSLRATREFQGSIGK